MCRDAGATGGATADGLLRPLHLCRGHSQAAGGGEGVPHVPAAAFHHSPRQVPWEEDTAAGRALPQQEEWVWVGGRAGRRRGSRVRLA